MTVRQQERATRRRGQDLRATMAARQQSELNSTGPPAGLLLASSSVGLGFSITLEVHIGICEPSLPDDGSLQRAAISSTESGSRKEEPQGPGPKRSQGAQKAQKFQAESQNRRD